ncbi:hypothetical protein M918_05915 [Clostridium sp. BL8]|nr:hypothetical protein M918_05915 [Clostridium sp. BL8]
MIINLEVILCGRNKNSKTKNIQKSFEDFITKGS